MWPRLVLSVGVDVRRDRLRRVAGSLVSAQELRIELLITDSRVIEPVD